MNAVIEIKNGVFYYRNGIKKEFILNQLDMRVDHGTIYGLLGASGCGKTTLISCIVGLQKLKSGDLYVFGEKIDSNNNIHGPRIGYMPQETALVRELSIKEILYYFGNIYELPLEKLRDQYIRLRNLLHLPDGESKIKNCSGGQKRRVSLAIAIIHSPKLIILDEPTVGLDSILRSTIWDFLIEKVRNESVSILLSTHYIEEARQASSVGFMRHGKILAQGPPLCIIENLGTSTLEEAFLVLSKNNKTLQIDSCLNANVSPGTPVSNSTPKSIGRKKFTTLGKMKALLVKNTSQLIRQPVIYTFFVLTIISFIIVLQGVGTDPKYLKIGVVNEEIDSFKDCTNETLIGCNWYKSSCKFLNGIDPELLEKIFFDTLEDAYQQVRKGNIIGVIHFGSNFSNAMASTVNNSLTTDDIIDAKTISIRLDQSEKQISGFTSRKLYKVYEMYMEDLTKDCKLPSKLFRYPLVFDDPIYGSKDETFTTFLIVGIMAAWAIYFSTLLTITTFIDDRIEGVWDRSIVAGVNPYEFLVSHMILQFIMVIMECFLILLVTLVLFKVENNGNIFAIVTLLVLIGCSGMCLGFAISVFCKSYLVSSLIGVFGFMSTITYSGLIWPLEGSPYFLQLFGKALPLAISTNSLRSLMLRGLPFYHPTVLPGYMVSMCWIIILLIICLLKLKFKG